MDSHVLAKSMLNNENSAIRELLKAAQNKDLISLAGGLPAPETFPTEIIKNLASKVIDIYGDGLFQYSITEGFPALTSALSSYLVKRGINETKVCVSTGAQSAIDSAAKILIDEGDIVGIESPTFLAAIKAFKAYGPKFVGMKVDENGIVPDQLEKILRTTRVKLIYIIPNFQNPTGRTLSLERRKEIAELVKKYETIIIEDDPYYELRYQGVDLPPLFTLAPENVIYVGSLSKVFSPGMRLGYYVASDLLRNSMTSVRQGVDVHANSLSQAIASLYISEGYLERQIKLIREVYEPRLKAMQVSLQKYLPDTFTWSKPDGGMYVWVEGPVGFDAKVLGKKALSKGVAFVPGEHFFFDPKNHENTFRLNFTNTSEEKIKKAIEIIASVI